MKLYRLIIFLLFCLSVLFSSCSKDDSDLESPGFSYDFFPSLIPNLRNYPFVTRMSEIEEEPYGHRVPTRCVSCTVDMNEGIWIEGISKEDILSYEIYEETGVCEGIFSDEQDFMSFIYSVSGFHIVRFLTSDSSLVGCVEVPESVRQDISEISDSSDKVFVFTLHKLNNTDYDII
ncbi:MAG: hypothetical protein K2H47_11830 [Muribaculaceae bacterium]|nr:hypothetical protein [Muribaculaceae bacterium]